MLKDERGNTVGVSQPGIYNKLSVYYEGKLICNDYLLLVEDTGRLIQ